VQVGAFRDADAAARLVQRLRRHAVTIALAVTGWRRWRACSSGRSPSARPPFRRARAAGSGLAAFIADTLD